MDSLWITHQHADSSSQGSNHQASNGRQPTLPSLLATDVREICLCFVCVKVKKMLVDILDYWILKLPSDSFFFSKKLSDDISAMGFQFWPEIKYLSNWSFIIYLFSKQPAHQWFPLYSSQLQWSTCFTQHPLFQAMCGQLSGAISIRKSPQLNWLTEIQTGESGNPFTQWQ